jgi:hypothetical protein
MFFGVDQWTLLVEVACYLEGKLVHFHLIFVRQEWITVYVPLIGYSILYDYLIRSIDQSEHYIGAIWWPAYCSIIIGDLRYRSYLAKLILIAGYGW